ncbi:hypothetical protein GOP47_0030289 [Adiantum capillus-veneris]|nr:hypothetical protein GOP47_0030289 [Adiantum capillus-veneris]
MVLEVQQQQQPIMRDFLGLGKLVADNDPAKGESCAHKEEPFHSVPGFFSASINMDSTGAKYPNVNMGAVEHSFCGRKNLHDRYLEGSAETFGLSGTKRWPGMVSNTARIEANAKPSSMQLTIFYGGHVNVYNNIPVDRAEAIMHMAAKGDLLPPTALTPFGVSHTTVAPGFCQPTMATENDRFNTQMGAPILFAADQASQNGLPLHKPFDCVMPDTPSTATSPQPVVPRALPLARKASLARFLEKRKERMQMMSPYLKKQIAPAQQGEQTVCFLQNATLSEVYGQYFARPTMVYHMQEQTDVSLNGSVAKQ